MKQATAVLSRLVDNIGPGGVYAHLRGDIEDPVRTPVVAGRINIQFRDPRIKELKAGWTYGVEIAEVDLRARVEGPLEPAPFWVFIDNVSAAGINGHDRTGPYDGRTQGDTVGQFIVTFRDPQIYYALQAGLTYRMTIR